MRRLGAFICGIALATGAVPAGAGADTVLGTAGGASYVQDSLGVTGPDDALVDLTCPADTKATGGGFDSTGFSETTALWSFPFPTSWRTYQHLAANGSQTAYGYLICKDANLRYPEREVRVKAGETGAVTVSCADGRHVAGGGALIQAPPGEAKLNSSYPFDGGDNGTRPDDGWKARAWNAEDDANFLRVVAVCQKQEPRYVDVSNDLVPSGTGAAIPFCGNAEHVIGIGAKLAGPAQSSELHVLKPQDNPSEGGSLPEDGALANAGNAPGAGANKRLTGYAICEG